MTLKKLFKVLDKYMTIQVSDREGTTTNPMTVEEFKDQYGKEALKREVIYIDFSVHCDNVIVIDVCRL